MKTTSIPASFGLSELGSALPQLVSTFVSPTFCFWDCVLWMSSKFIWMEAALSHSQCEGAPSESRSEGALRLGFWGCTLRIVFWGRPQTWILRVHPQNCLLRAPSEKCEDDGEHMFMMILLFFCWEIFQRISNITFLIYVKNPKGCVIILKKSEGRKLILDG